MGSVEVKAKSMHHPITISRVPNAEGVYIDFSDEKGKEGYGVLTEPEVYQLVLELVTKAELFGGYSEGNMGFFVARPESEAVLARKDELSKQFFTVEYEAAGVSAKNAVDFIVKGEIDRGELS